MKQKLLQILKTKTIQQSIVTLSGTLLNGVLGMLFFLFLARNLGPQNFGIVSFSIVILTLISDIADFGINTGIINFVSKHFLSDSVKTKQILKLSFEGKFLIWILVLIFGWLTMPFITWNILQKPELDPYLKLSLIGVGGAMLFSYTSSSLQAMQRYKIWSFLNITMNLTRLLLVIVLIYGSILTSVSSLLLYFSITFLGFFIGSLFLPKGLLLVKGEISQFKELFHFNKWIALTILISAISSRVDSIFLTKLTSLRDVGIYSVASQLASYVPQLSGAVAIVAAPKFSSFTNESDARRYFYKLSVLCFGLALLGLIIIPLIWFFIPIFYGVSYKDSSLIFGLLFIANLILFVSTPAHQAIYYFFSNSKIAFLITLAVFIVNIILMWFMITFYSLIGAALAVLLVSLLNLIIPTLWVINKFKNK